MVTFYYERGHHEIELKMSRSLIGSNGNMTIHGPYIDTVRGRYKGIGMTMQSQVGSNELESSEKS